MIAVGIDVQNPKAQLPSWTPMVLFWQLRSPWHITSQK